MKFSKKLETWYPVRRNYILILVYLLVIGTIVLTLIVYLLSITVI